MFLKVLAVICLLEVSGKALAMKCYDCKSTSTTDDCYNVDAATTPSTMCPLSCYFFQYVVDQMEPNRHNKTVHTVRSCDPYVDACVLVYSNKKRIPLEAHIRHCFLCSTDLCNVSSRKHHSAFLILSVLVLALLSQKQFAS